MTKTLLELVGQTQFFPIRLCCTTLIFIGTILSFSVSAQGILEEVVVTAQKREQNLQDVPLSINAVSGDLIQRMGLDNAVELSRFVPGLVSNGTSNSDQRFAIRGVGSLVTNLAGAETSVGVYHDNIYSGQTYLGGANFFDVGHVEVVKGPQGTLFGRNTSAGAISVTSNKADREEIYADTRIGFGNDDQQIYEAIGNYSTSSDWGLRAGVQYQKRDGTFRNTTNGEELNGLDDVIARVGFQRDWSDRFRSDIKLDYFHSENRSGATAIDQTNLEGSAGVTSVTQNTRDDSGTDLVRGNMTLAYDINDTFTLTTITSFLDASLNITTVDSDISPLALIQFDGPTKHFNFGQEFRLNGTKGSVDWFVGASVFYEDNEISLSARFSDFDLIPFLPSILPPGSVPPGITCPTSPVAAFCNADARETAFTTNETLAFGIYGDATWQVTDQLALTVGARYSYDDKEPTSNIPLPTTNALHMLTGNTLFLSPSSAMNLDGNDSWNNFSPRFAAAYQLNDAVLGYANVNFGYKAGGFNIFPDNFAPAPQQIQSFDEETVVSYEAGFKSDFVDGRARLNAAFFFIDYTDFQFEDTNAVGIPLTRTIDSAENYGLDIEASFVPLDGLKLNLGYQYLESDIKNSTPMQEGNPLPFSPEHTVTARGRYEFPVAWGLVSAQLVYNYVDDYFLNPNGSSSIRTASHDTVDIRLDLTSHNEKWSVAVIGENITDERWFNQINVGLVSIGYPNVGELWRAEFTYRFD